MSMSYLAASRGGSEEKATSSLGRTPTSSELAAEAEAKRRKVQRACDVCRRKKIRCEGPMNSHSASKCANCQEYGLECTYVEAAKRRGPPKGYLDTLEQRCRRLERLITQLHPGLEVSGTVGPMPDRDDFDLAVYQDQMRTLGIPPYPTMKPIATGDAHAPCAAGTPPTAQGAPSPSPRVLGPAPWQAFEQDPNRPPEDDEEIRDQARIAHAMVKLNIRDYDAFRFHGKASPAHLVRIVNELKYSDPDLTFFDRLSNVKRPEYWMVPEWEKQIATVSVNPVDYSMWPDEELAARLIDSYFERVNRPMPLLNRVIFQRQYQSGLWRTNIEFAKLCLMIFANGARYVDDERVYWPADDATTEEGRERLRNDRNGMLKYSAGWIYLRALIKMGRSWLQGPSLLDLQTNVLVCLFLNGSAVPHLAWIVAGSGLRMAQEIGVHVRSTMLLINPIDRALYNRAFWCLYHFDRLSCAAMGRSVAIQDSDFDADYPMAIDDEYWDTGDPERDFKQPPGLSPDPAVSAFTQLLKLDHVLSAALRTIYAVTKLPEHGEDQRAIVVELDSALNAWADAVPDNLRWDPTRSDPLLFEHSAILYAHYYYVQILIHRPFIPTPKHPESVGFPSLAICSNAARSISNILDAVLRRGRSMGKLPGNSIGISFVLPASTAAIVLLMNVYAVRQRPHERERCMSDVRRVIAAVREMELTYRQAGKITDLITEIARESTGDKELTIDTPPPKRPYDDDNDCSTAVETPGAPELMPLASAALSHAQAHASFQPGQPPLACMSQTSDLHANGSGSTPNSHLNMPPGNVGSRPESSAASPPTPPFMYGHWGTGMTPTGEPVAVPDQLFDPNDLQNLNYAAMNFDMLGDAHSDNFWQHLLRQGGGGLSTFGAPTGGPNMGIGNPPPLQQQQQQQPQQPMGGPMGTQPTGFGFMPWLPPDEQRRQH
ncbi:hypothetical protein CspHIS471_0402250 [Cutaneotrichosporon sp. HIS471]|nr:hypothetical protein CspHIS471_0402250 [Cutaneotrichosporon sp. HIS471]